MHPTWLLGVSFFHTLVSFSSLPSSPLRPRRLTRAAHVHQLLRCYQPIGSSDRLDDEQNRRICARAGVCEHGISEADTDGVAARECPDEYVNRAAWEWAPVDRLRCVEGQCRFKGRIAGLN